jgi:hypothetical protein
MEFTHLIDCVAIAVAAGRVSETVEITDRQAADLDCWRIPLALATVQQQ